MIKGYVAISQTHQDYQKYSPGSKYYIEVSCISLSEYPPIGATHKEYWVNWLAKRKIEVSNLQSLSHGFRAFFSNEAVTLSALRILKSEIKEYAMEEVS